jgi:hypothetical protein
VTKAALVIGMKPEEEARKKIDALLEVAGWIVQSFEDLNFGAGLGVAVREFPLKAQESSENASSSTPKARIISTRDPSMFCL